MSENENTARITLRVSPQMKREVTQTAKSHGLSVSWLMKRAWQLMKDAVSKGEIKL